MKHQIETIFMGSVYKTSFDHKVEVWGNYFYNSPLLGLRNSLLSSDSFLPSIPCDDDLFESQSLFKHNDFGYKINFDKGLKFFRSHPNFNASFFSFMSPFIFCEVVSSLCNFHTNLHQTLIFLLLLITY